MKKNQATGFTLIEVMLALVIISIALTALIKSSAQTVVTMVRVKDKAISHEVAMQGVAMFQLGLLTQPINQETTHVTTFLGQRWYWRAKLTPTIIKNMQQINISVSKNNAGPFMDDLIAFKTLGRTT